MNTKITFHFILADNDVDGDNEAFTNGALEEICKLCIGHYGLFDGTEVEAKITNASIMDSCGATKDGRHKRFIYAEAEFPNNEHGEKLISKILLEKPKSSIACSALNRDKVADDVTMISNVTDFYNFLLRFDEEKETMDKNELERRLEAAEKQMIGLQDEIQNLKAKLSEMEQENEIPEYPVCKAKDKYFVVEENGIIHDFTSVCGGTRYKYNMFHTKSYAQEFADKCKLIAMMLHCKWHLCRDYKEDFEDAEYKWYVHYANNTIRFATACFATDYCVDNDHGSVYFDTEENAQKCAEWLNKHWKEDGNE